MKKLIMFVSLFCIVSVAAGKVSTRVCFTDSNTPLVPFDSNLPNVEYPDIMVGTKLMIIVDSNVAKYWSGSLTIEGANMDYGVLSCRDCNEAILDCDGSVLPAAGERAQVEPWENTGVRGYDLYTDSRNITPGDWFVIDYVATNIGLCNVGFYDHSVSPFEPSRYLTFSHVPTRDFDGDTVVSFGDWAILAQYWCTPFCNGPDWCEGADIDRDHDVDFGDLTLFTDYWLERTQPPYVDYCAGSFAGVE
ncbi:MAG: hypothetical protein JXN61_06780 [Sedimentisphaerales bacterium]|nr:hypothetical protein [Sedimentisphaerales bacterium]